MSCVTKKYRDRDILKQRDLKINPDKYLSPKELRKVSCPNDLIKYKKHRALNLTRKYNKHIRDIDAITYKHPHLKINLKKYQHDF